MLLALSGGAEIYISVASCFSIKSKKLWLEL
nr:MAG TPA: hypothetical protein [Caudoviricetes sp.]